jgi:Transposase DDE domain
VSADLTGHQCRAAPRQSRVAAGDAGIRIHKQRNVVERAINKLKAHRGVATRFDKRHYTFRGTIDLASIRLWLRDLVP